jgi:ABC-type branched-subunit amino acid transport system substrate-binding protein
VGSDACSDIDICGNEARAFWSRAFVLERSMGAMVRIGLLFSTTGPYGVVGRSMLNGARLAVEEIAADPSFDFAFEAVLVDPGGSNIDYAKGARRLLIDEQITHVVGCYTSSSRKEVLPLFEKYDGLLWYPSHYEGFESSYNIIYTGAAPNQHILPLVEHLLRTCGRRAYCIGSNYVWAWENNRILRDAILSDGGTVLAERYFPVGEIDFDAVIDQILHCGPSFVFNTLIGISAYEFFRALRRAAVARGIDQPKVMPIASCSLAEPELVEIGPEACDGHLSSSVYFESIAGAANCDFVKHYRRSFPQDGPTSADAEASYVAVHLIARAIRTARSADMASVLMTLPSVVLDAPQGVVHVDRENRHSYLTPRIGLSNAGGGFDIIYEAPGPVRPDPYLVWQGPMRQMRPQQGPRLRIVP